jgi:hypothetical protein
MIAKKPTTKPAFDEDHAPDLSSPEWQEKFAKAWSDSFSRLSEKETWLKDQNSPEYKRTVELLQKVPMLTSMPDGLVHAVELMKLQDIVENEVSRRETTKYNTEGESHERNLS